MAADTIPITPGSGKNIGVDNCGADGQIQFFKLCVSADGSIVRVPADATNGLDVDVTRLPKSSTLTLADPAPTTTATLIKASAAGRKAISIKNAGTVVVYLGGANTVTTSTGWSLDPGETWSDDVYTGDWYGITASGTGDIRVIEFT